MIIEWNWWKQWCLDLNRSRGSGQNHKFGLTDHDVTRGMYLIPQLWRLFARLFQRQSSPNGSQEVETSFPQDVKSIDPSVLAAAMGGTEPPEEPIFSTFEEGFGYFTDAAVSRSLKQYEFVRKVSTWPFQSRPRLIDLIIEHSSVGLFLPLYGSRCQFFIDSPPTLTYLFHKYSDRSAETRNFVALKILTSQATAKVVAGNSPEYKVNLKIMSTNPSSPGFNHCLTIRGYFITKSAAGGHICFVMVPLSSSLADLRPPGQNQFTVPTAKRIIKQVLLALDYLHRECGYIHTGGSIFLFNMLPDHDDKLRSQIREHPCWNTSTSSFSNRKLYSVKPSVHLWPSPQPKIFTFASHFLMHGTSSLSRTWWISWGYLGATGGLQRRWVHLLFYSLSPKHRQQQLLSTSLQNAIFVSHLSSAPRRLPSNIPGRPPSTFGQSVVSYVWCFHCPADTETIPAIQPALRTSALRRACRKLLERTSFTIYSWMLGAVPSRIPPRLRRSKEIL